MKSPNPKLSVAFLYDDSLDRSSNGVTQYVRQLGSWLSEQGHQVTYLVGETTMKSWRGGQVISLSKNIKVSFNGNHLTIPLSSRASHIKQTLAQHKFDVVHVQVPYSPLMASRVIKRLPDSTAVIGTFHILPVGALAKLGSRLLSITLRRSLRRFDKIVSVSRPAKEFARNVYGIKSSIVPNVVEIASFNGAKPTKKNGKTIVYLGRLDKRKGCRQLIEAFEVLHQRLPDARLVIGGKGPESKKLRKLVSRHGLASNVEFAGFIAEEDKASFLANGDIACFPSLAGESFGIVLIEAMAAGAGVVLGGDNPGYRSVLGDQPQLLIDPYDKKQFAKRLELLLTDRRLAGELNEWQSKQVKQYDVAVVGRKLEVAYTQAVAKRRASAA